MGEAVITVSNQSLIVLKKLKKILCLFAFCLATSLVFSQSIKNISQNNDSQALVEKCQSLGYVNGTAKMKQCLSEKFIVSQQSAVDSKAFEKCQSLGYVNGTDKMRQCLSQVYLNSSQTNTQEGEVIGTAGTTAAAVANTPAESKCDGYGFQRGTTAYSQCLMNVDTQMNQAAYQQSIQQQQQLKNGAELLRGDGRTPGSMNCYGTPGVPGSVYCR